MEELLQRYIQGEVSDQEREQIARWLDENPENRREFMALHKLYDISLWNNVPKKKKKSLKFNPSLRHIFQEALKIAAILLIGFLVSRQIMIHQSEEINMQTIHVPAGQRAELTLADGTLVWLNARSTLRFPDRFTEKSRNVELDGEGYFTVKHDEASPFTVQTERYAIRVLGTEFNVKAYRNNQLFETSLLHGSVEISAPGMRDNLRLRPNEIAWGNQGRLTISAITDYNYFKWKEGLFCFEDETIEALIEKLQLYYDIKIEVRKSSLLTYHYSGKFRIQDGIEHVLKVLQLKHKFTYTKNDEKNLIIIQ